MSDRRMLARRLVGAAMPAARADNDYYATEPEAVLALARVEALPALIADPACGTGETAAPLVGLGHRVVATDLVDRGYGRGGVDFLRTTRAPAPAIVTNPPYELAAEFIWHALGQLQVERLALLLRFAFYPAHRGGLLDLLPPVRVHAFTWRVRTVKGGDWSIRPGLIDLAWFVWHRGHRGKTELARLHKVPAVAGGGRRCAATPEAAPLQVAAE